MPQIHSVLNWRLCLVLPEWGTAPSRIKYINPRLAGKRKPDQLERGNEQWVLTTFQYAGVQAMGFGEDEAQVANELNVDLQGARRYFGYMTTRETGAIGGNMVKKMIEAAERPGAAGGAGVQSGFLAGLSNFSASAGAGQSQNQSQNQYQNQNQDTIPNDPNLNLNTLNQFF